MERRDPDEVKGPLMKRNLSILLTKKYMRC